MNTPSPRSLGSLLWEIVRFGARVMWKNSTKPASTRAAFASAGAGTVLGLPLNATPQQIKRRYRVLAKKHHPDRGGNPHQMQRIIAAYEKLYLLFDFCFIQSNFTLKPELLCLQASVSRVIGGTDADEA